MYSRPHRPPPRPFPSRTQPRAESATNLFTRVVNTSTNQHAELCAQHDPQPNPQFASWRAYDPSPPTPPMTASPGPMHRFASLMGSADMGMSKQSVLEDDTDDSAYSPPSSLPLHAASPCSNPNGTPSQHPTFLFGFDLSNLPRGDQATPTRPTLYERRTAHQCPGRRSSIPPRAPSIPNRRSP